MAVRLKEPSCTSLKFAVFPLLLDNILALATHLSLNMRGLCVRACVRVCMCARVRLES
jgi:hypothetical protein